jgi:hypothetical protein
MKKNRALLFIAGLLLSVLALEMIARAISPVLGPPLISWNTMEDAKRLKFDEYLEKYQNPKYVVMGNSTSLIGFNPTIFDTSANLPIGSSFNAAMNGSDIKTIRDFALDFVIDEVKPKNLVLLFSNTSMIQGPKYQEFKLNTGNLLSNSYLYKYRNNFRDPMTINTILRTLKFQDTRQGIVYRWADNIDEFGYTKYETTDATFPESGWDPTKEISSDSRNYSVDGEKLTYLTEIRDYAEKNGVNLIIGTVPLLAKDLAYRGTVRQIADDLGVGFIQGNDAVGQGKYFQDGIHLNRKGAKLFSEYLGKSIPSIASILK